MVHTNLRISPWYAFSNSTFTVFQTILRVLANRRHVDCYDTCLHGTVTLTLYATIRNRINTSKLTYLAGCPNGVH
jgi:hypothetical protein